MLNGTFPSSNVVKVGHQTESGPATSESFQIGSETHTIGQRWVDCDYYINLPSAWNISQTGVTMALKGMMPVVTGGLTYMHSLFTSETTPPLSILCSQPMLKEKQVLVLLDAICICPTSNTVKEGYKILASTDMVAADYQGTLLLKEEGLTTENETKALKVCELAAKAPYNLGTDDPGNMEVINIGPPWTTEIIASGNTKISAKDFLIKTQPSGTVFNYPGQRATVEIFDMQGRKVWIGRSSENRITWNNVNMNGSNVTAGMYLYQLKVGEIRAQGRIAVR